MGLCSYVERRRQRYYFRARLPAALAAFLGKSHLIGSLGTADPHIAKRRAGRAIWSLAGRLEIMVSRMVEIHDIDGWDLSRAERLAAEAFRLGRAYEARKAQLRQEFRAELKALAASFRYDDVPRDPANGDACARNDADTTSVRPAETEDLVIPSAPSGRPTTERAEIPPPEHNVSPETPAASPVWTTLVDAFFQDKPGLAAKTRWSYQQAFARWRELLGDKPIASIRRPDLKLFADHLRDRPNPRGGQLNHKTILRSLGHIKNFMSWAVAAGYAEDDHFGAVQARSPTRDERHAEPSRRAFTEDELTRLFRSKLFLFPRNQNDRADAMFLLVAALTGARTEELATAPATLIRLGDVHCLDLRGVGRKTSAAPRLVPLLPDLVQAGLLEWANEQLAAGYTLLQPGPTQRSAAGWSKRLNRYISKTIAEDPDLVLYSLRHGFRQMLRAAMIGDELADKIFGHATGKVGAGYGRDLSVQEAALYVERVRPPVDLRHLWHSP